MHSTESGNQGRTITKPAAVEPRAAGTWLAAWRYMSVALARGRWSRFLWTGVSRPLRQYWARRLDTEVWARLPGNLWIPARLWEHVEAGVFWYGFPAEDVPTFQVLSAALPRDGVFLDIGANVGVFSLPLASRAGQGRVHAFEPVPAAAERLRRNIDINAIDNIRVNQCAASDHAGTLSIQVPESHWKGRLFNDGMASTYVGRGRPGWRTETVGCVRLDDYAREQGLGRVDAIKLDVEGSELDVLAGAGDLLRSFRPLVVMEVNPGPLAAARRSVDEVMEFWRSQDYRVGAVGHGGRVHWGRRPGGRHCNICCAPIGGS